MRLQRVLWQAESCYSRQFEKLSFRNLCGSGSSGDYKGNCTSAFEKPAPQCHRTTGWLTRVTTRSNSMSPHYSLFGPTTRSYSMSPHYSLFGPGVTTHDPFEFHVAALQPVRPRRHDPSLDFLNIYLKISQYFYQKIWEIL